VVNLKEAIRSKPLGRRGYGKKGKPKKEPKKAGNGQR